MNKKTKINKNTFISYILFILFMIAVVLLVKGANVKVNKLSYDEFLRDLNNNKVTELVVTPKQSSSIYQITGKLNGYKEGETFTISIPYSDSLVTDVVKVANEKNLKVNVKKDPGGTPIVAILANVLPLVLLIGFAAFLPSPVFNSAIFP